MDETSHMQVGIDRCLAEPGDRVGAGRRHGNRDQDTVRQFVEIHCDGHDRACGQDHCAGASAGRDMEDHSQGLRVSGRMRDRASGAGLFAAALGCVRTVNMRPCPKTIDKPLLILGLEGEDIAVLMLVFGIPAILVSPGIPLGLIFIAWPLLVYFKRGKPEGYILHVLYRRGLPLKGLLPPGEDVVYSPYSCGGGHG